MVAGGIAMVLHGVVRLTADLDIIVDMAPRNVEKFIRAMEALGYRPRIPVEAMDFADPAKRELWMKEKGIQVLTFFHPKRALELVDVFTRELLPFSDLYKDRKIVSARSVKVPIVSIKHLKKLKRIAGRPQDLADIESLRNLEAIRRKEG